MQGADACGADWVDCVSTVARENMQNKRLTDSVAGTKIKTTVMNFYYFNKDGYRVTGWQTINGKKCYFNSKGVRQTSFIKVGSKWYYADKKTGKFVKGWKKIHGKYYKN